MRPVRRDVPPRATLLIVLLVLVAGIVTGGEKSAPQEALVKESARPAVATAPAQDEADVRIAPRQPAERPGTDLFASHSWAPKPPPAPPPAPVSVPEPVVPKVEPPSAPPLPFRYLGQIESRSRAIVFLIRGEELVIAAAGDTIDNSYRIEAIGDTTVEFVYLPLGVRQSLSVPSVAERGG